MYSGSSPARCSRSATESGAVGGAGGGHGVADEPLRPGLVLAGDDRGLCDARVAQQRRLDLAELDAVAADLHLAVVAAEEVQRPVGAPARAVAGAVHARAGRGGERVGDEALGGEGGAAEVAAREAAAADVQLAGDAGGDELQRVVEHVRARVRIRHADRHGPRPAGLRVPERGVDGRLGQAVGDDDLHALRPARDELGLHRLGADDEQGPRGQQTVGRQRGDERGGQDHVGDALLGEVVGQRRARDAAMGGHDHGAAADAERHAQIEDGDVEADRGELRDAAGRVDAEPVDRGRDQAADPFVGNDDALRAAGRAGGVDHVGGLVECGRPGDVWIVLVAGVVVVAVSDIAQQQRLETLDRGQLPGQLAVGHDDPRARVAQHERDAVGRMVEVQRQICGARAHHAEQRDDHVHRAGHRDRDDVLVARPSSPQRTGQRSRAGVELVVGQRVVLAHDSDRVGRRARRGARTRRSR